MKMPLRFIGVIMFLFLGLLVGVDLTPVQGNQDLSTTHHNQSSQGKFTPGHRNMFDRILSHLRM